MGGRERRFTSVMVLSSSSEEEDQLEEELRVRVDIVVGAVVVAGRLVLEALVERDEDEAIVLLGWLVLALVVCEVEELCVLVELPYGGGDDGTDELLDFELELDDRDELSEEDVDLDDSHLLLDLELVLEDREELSEVVVD